MVFRQTAVELYDKKTSDLLYTYAVPQPPFLVGTMLANVGDLSNRGIEFTFNAILMRRNEFSWDLNLNLAHNKQKIERLSNQVYETDVIYTGSLHNLRGMSNQYSQVIMEGYPVGTFWGPVCSGLDEEGKFILENDGEAQYLGDVQPVLSLGLSTSARYKNFDFEISTYGMFGQEVLNATAMSMSDPSRLPAQNVPDSYLESGITDDPTYSSYWIEDASFFRLQSATIGYSQPINKIGIDKIRFYITGENLFVFTNYTGIDPEVRIEDNSDPANPNDALSNPGIDMFNYFPKPLTVSIGLNLMF
ncbi:TonB-dependent receptor P3 [subsurface metagenome]